MSARMFHRKEFTIDRKRRWWSNHNPYNLEPGYYPPVRFVMCPEHKWIVWVDEKADAELLRDAHNQKHHVAFTEVWDEHRRRHW